MMLRLAWLLLQFISVVQAADFDDLKGTNIFAEQAETPAYERLQRLYKEDPRLQYAKTHGLEPLADTMFGFYIHTYNDPAAVVHMVDRLNTTFPNSPIYIMSDGGTDFTNLCELYACTFRLCPPANDRWNPWPFLRRMWDAAVVLKTEYMIMLEPDNTVHRQIYIHPEHDAGGLEDANPHFHYETVEYIERLGRTHRPSFQWKWTGSGLAGGAYFRTAAVLDAFSDASVAELNWTKIEIFESKRVFSSDFAMPVVLGAKGYTYAPWQDITQYDLRGDPAIKIVTHQPLEAAFAHYGRGVDGGKPTYNLKVTQTLSRLLSNGKFRRPEAGHRNYNFQTYTDTHKTQECTNRLAFGDRGWPTEEQRHAVKAELAESFGGAEAFKMRMQARKKMEEEADVVRKAHAKEIKLKMYGPDHIDDLS
eukprot:m.10678 g.10678  ORF g.10678 m.10678 type:complete len:420 (+) comp8437_c0_seq1:256-1515(+)